MDMEANEPARKKAWSPPALERLKVEKTLGGTVPGQTEDWTSWGNPGHRTGMS